MNLRGWLSGRIRRWWPLDWILAAYTSAVGALILIRWEYFTTPGSLLAAHVGIVLFLLALPPHGSAWERRKPWEKLPETIVRQVLRFFRYTYPVLLVVFYFEEAQQTVRVVAAGNPYWFEKWLYGADRQLFGTLPALALADHGGPLLDELMHFFYFSYYLIIAGVTIFAFFGPQWKPPPARGFEAVITSCVTAYLFAFVWYPFLPARGPWENPELMAQLPEFRGAVFMRMVQAIIERGAVSGGCFPSGHVAGTWGAVLGLARYYPRTGGALAVAAVGMSIACVYTRYHHAVDVLAGLLAAAAGAWVAFRLTNRSEGNHRETPKAAASAQ